MEHPPKQPADGTVKGKRFYLAWLLGAVGCYLTFVDQTHGPRVLKAAFHNGSNLPTAAEFGYACVFALACIGMVGVVDVLFARWFVGRYFALHTVVNAVIVYWSAAEAFSVFGFANPYDAMTCVAEGSTCGKNAPILLQSALHIWHGLACTVIVKLAIS